MTVLSKCIQFLQKKISAEDLKEVERAYHGGKAIAKNPNALLLPAGTEDLTGVRTASSTDSSAPALGPSLIPPLQAAGGKKPTKEVTPALNDSEQVEHSESEKSKLHAYFHITHAFFYTTHALFVYYVHITTVTYKFFYYMLFFTQYIHIFTVTYIFFLLSHTLLSLYQ